MASAGSAEELELGYLGSLLGFACVESIVMVDALIPLINIRWGIWAILHLVLQASTTIASLVDAVFICVVPWFLTSIVGPPRPIAMLLLII